MKNSSKSLPKDPLTGTTINELGEKGVFLHFSNPFGETNKK